jgi:hypothetical protein
LTLDTLVEPGRVPLGKPAKLGFAEVLGGMRTDWAVCAMAVVPGVDVVAGGVVTDGVVAGVVTGVVVTGGVVTGGVVTGGVVTGGVVTGGAVTGGVVTGGVVMDARLTQHDFA